MVNEIKTIDDFTKAIGDETTGLVVIDFWAEWCGPCKRIAPFYSDLSKKYPNVGFYKINTDVPTVSEVLQACEISAMPSFCFFVKGKYMDKIIGANQKKLEESVVKNIPIVVPVEPVIEEKTKDEKTKDEEIILQ